MALHLVRAQGAYKDIRILSFHHTHIAGDGLVQWEENNTSVCRRDEMDFQVFMSDHLRYLQAFKPFKMCLTNWSDVSTDWLTVHAVIAESFCCHARKQLCFFTAYRIDNGQPNFLICQLYITSSFLSLSLSLFFFFCTAYHGQSCTLFLFQMKLVNNTKFQCMYWV